jgi:antitoxin MazE
MYQQGVTMRKKLTRHGNSLALVIDRPILDLVNIQADQSLEISTDDGRRLIISPVQDEKTGRKIRQAVKTADRRYGRMFKRLAK